MTEKAQEILNAAPEETKDVEGKVIAKKADLMEDNHIKSLLSELDNQ